MNTRENLKTYFLAIENSELISDHHGTVNGHFQSVAQTSQLPRVGIFAVNSGHPYLRLLTKTATRERHLRTSGRENILNFSWTNYSITIASFFSVDTHDPVRVWQADRSGQAGPRKLTDRKWVGQGRAGQSGDNSARQSRADRGKDVCPLGQSRREDEPLTNPLIGTHV